MLLTTCLKWMYEYCVGGGLLFDTLLALTWWHRCEQAQATSPSFLSRHQIRLSKSFAVRARNTEKSIEFEMVAFEGVPHTQQSSPSNVNVAQHTTYLT